MDEPPPLDREGAEQARALLTSGAKIATLAGNGALRSQATADLIKVAAGFGIPVASTLRAKGVFPEDHALSLGVFGYGGHGIQPWRSRLTTIPVRTRLST